VKRPLPFLLLLILLLAGCGRAQGNEATLSMKNMQFLQSELHVKAGQPVTLHLVNQDGYTHTFDIDAFDIHTQLAANETLQVTFTADEPGRFPFYCGSPGHEAAGMMGTLIVEQ